MMIKQTLIGILSLLTLLMANSCSETGKANTITITRKFFLNHEIPRNIDFEIYLNQKVLTKSRETGHMPGPYELNQKLVTGAVQKIRIKIMPAAGSAKVLNPKSIEFINKNLGIYLLENKDYDHIKTIKLLQYPVITKDTAEYDYEWTFNIKQP